MGIGARVVGATLILCLFGIVRATEAVPEHARDAFERGLVAAEQTQWAIAIREFQKAHGVAPKASQIFFNLGLAHAKAGHELPAIAWFQAYLAAEPRAPNADALRKEILRLEIATQAKISKILQEMLAAAEKRDANSRKFAVDQVRAMQARTGDVEGALRGGLSEEKIWIGGKVVSASDRAWSLYAQGLAKGAVVDKFEQALRYVSDVSTRDGLNGWIADSLARRAVGSQRTADLARATAQRIQNPQSRAAAMANVLLHDFRRGDRPLAEKLVSELPESNLERQFLLGRMIAGAVVENDFAAATRYAGQIIRVGAGKAPSDWEVEALQPIFAAQLARGDAAGARATAQELLAAATGVHHANLEAVRGNYEAARALMPKLKCDQKARLAEWTIFVQGATGDLAGARNSARAAAAACATDGFWGKEETHIRHLFKVLFAKSNMRDAIAIAQEHAGKEPIVDALFSAASITFQEINSTRRVVDAAELKALEQAGRALLKDNYRQMWLELDLADAYDNRKDSLEAARLRVQAGRRILAKPEYAASQSEERIRKVVKALEGAGDPAGARVMGTLGQPANVVAAWTSSAKVLSRHDFAVDLAGAIKKAAQEAKTIPNASMEIRLGQLAEQLADQLFEFQGRAQK